MKNQYKLPRESFVCSACLHDYQCVLAWVGVFTFSNIIITTRMRKLGPGDKHAPSCRSHPLIKFNLTADNLACFKQLEKSLVCSQPSTHNASHHNPSSMAASGGRNRTLSSSSSFNEKVVIMQYHDQDVYIDKSTGTKSNHSSKSGRQGRREDSGSEGQDEFLESCLRVLTQQSDKPHYQLMPASHTPRSYEQYSTYYDSQGYLQEHCHIDRKRRSITLEQSRQFQIEFHSIEADGRTTVMIKNIPNKYTQDALIKQFTANHEGRFDFFYLPIDKKNGCNQGYAFINFTQTCYLRDFYLEFHDKKWRKFSSQKICNLTYATCQGPLELAEHFKNTKVMHQSDRKMRPLIGIHEANRRRDIEEIVRNQRNQE